MKVENKTKAPIEVTGGKALVIEARFYQEIADSMFEGAKRVLEAAGMSVDRLEVPGAMEIPAALQFSADAYDAYVVTGCVIRGETYHFEIVCNESARGVSVVGLAHDMAVGNAILTVDTMEQALERADPDRLDKGGDAARAALRMMAIRKQFA